MTNGLWKAMSWIDFSGRKVYKIGLIYPINRADLHN